MRDRTPLFVAAVLGTAVFHPVSAQDAVEPAAEALAPTQELAPSADPAGVPQDSASAPGQPVAEGITDAAADGTAPPPAEAASAEQVSTVAVDQASTEEAPAEESGQPANRLMEEIVVTAQKRQERLQDVPISIQAFSQEKLDVLGIQSVQDVQRATPGFTVTNSAGFNIVFMRGVGSDAFLPGVDSSVPFYMDGVPLLGVQGTADTLGRVERIEVLKGPQGTLFGRNATGGAISVITPDPDSYFASDVKMEYGNDNLKALTLFANIPLTDNLAFNISGFSNTRDNFMVNDTTGQVPRLFSQGGRLKAKWTLTDSLSATLTGTYQEIGGNASVDFQNVRPSPALAAILGPGDPKFDHHLPSNSRFGIEVTSWVYGGTIAWNPGPVDLKLILARQKVDATTVDADFDGTARPIAEAHGGGAYGSSQYVKQDTAELQILSNDETWGSDHFEWVAGMFYLSSIGGFDPVVFNLAPAALPALIPGTSAVAQQIDAILALAGLGTIVSEQGLALANYGLLDSKSYSGYAQGTLHIIDSVDLTAGVRYQDEKRKLKDSRTTYLLDDGNEVELPVPQPDLPILHPKQTSARFALQWRPFDDSNQIYTSWARSHKNPTYNTVNLLGNTFGTMKEVKAERVDTAELGIKTQLFDGNLTFNTAGFYTIQKNPLSSNISIPSGGVANFTNAEEAKIKGFDGDFLLVPLANLDPGLVITGGYSYIDAKYTSFKNGQGYDDESGLGFGGGGARLPARDLSGKRVPRVPKWAYTLGLNQRIDISSNHALEFGADTSWASKIYFLPQNSEFSVRKPTQLYNARVTYIYDPWKLEMTAFCNNLTDELYVESAFVSDFGTALIANENVRLYGLRVKFSFE